MSKLDDRMKNIIKIFQNNRTDQNPQEKNMKREEQLNGSMAEELNNKIVDSKDKG